MTERRKKGEAENAKARRREGNAKGKKSEWRRRLHGFAPIDGEIGEIGVLSITCNHGVGGEVDGGEGRGGFAAEEEEGGGFVVADGVEEGVVGVEDFGRIEEATKEFYKDLL